jgi:hypothetical protein
LTNGDKTISYTKRQVSVWKIYANENFSTTELNKKHNQKPKNKTEAEADKIEQLRANEQVN